MGDLNISIQHIYDLVGMKKLLTSIPCSAVLELVANGHVIERLCMN